jgi:hypothetical protein
MHYFRKNDNIYNETTFSEYTVENIIDQDPVFMREHIQLLLMLMIMMHLYTIEIEIKKIILLLLVERID